MEAPDGRFRNEGIRNQSQRTCPRARGPQGIRRGFVCPEKKQPWGLILLLFPKLAKEITRSGPVARAQHRPEPCIQARFTPSAGTRRRNRSALYIGRPMAECNPESGNRRREPSPSALPRARRRHPRTPKGWPKRSCGYRAGSKHDNADVAASHSAGQEAGEAPEIDSENKYRIRPFRRLTH
jgi:hypothetical protein